jgi:sodium/potassium-transporting ATPase subunit alpha
VGTVPEGLLLTLTVSLALSAKHMYAKNVLVKGMPSVENLGSTTVIASDKTGTLTQNRMTVQHAWYDGQLVTVPAARNIPQLKAAMKPGVIKGPKYDTKSPSWQALQRVATLCNNSRFVLTDPDDDEKPPLNLAEEVMNPEFNLLGMTCTGDASESALIKSVQLVRDVEEYHKANPKLHEIKFNSTNKWQLSIHKPEDPNEKKPLMVFKGAPERVINRCSKILIDGEEVPMTEEWMKKYLESYEGLGAMGERVLGFAMKNLDLPMDYAFTNKPEPNFPTEDLTFVGLMSLIDPPREGVPEAVSKCKRARIKVYMVTGDHPITALAIAKQVGIIDQDKWDAGKALVVKGDDIRQWMDIEDPMERQAKWDWALDHEQIVFARVSPAHKLLIVENCQRRGENVAVTGDGVNDAPALKKANTGIAMGISGKDVSKEAADMILMDDNF